MREEPGRGGGRAAEEKEALEGRREADLRNGRREEMKREREVERERREETVVEGEGREEEGVGMEEGEEKDEEEEEEEEERGEEEEEEIPLTQCGNVAFTTTKTFAPVACSFRL